MQHDSFATGIRLSQHPRLRDLKCYQNHLTKLDVRKNKALETLICFENDLNALDLKNNTKLETLATLCMGIPQIDLRNCPKLRDYILSHKPKSYEHAHYYGPIALESTGFYYQTKLILWDTVKGLRYITDRKAGTADFFGPEDINIKEMDIPDTVKISGKTYKVTAIRNNACKGLKKLAKLTIGENVEKIGKNAFSQCKKLVNIVIKSKNLTASGIGSSAFSTGSKKPTVKCPKGKKDEYKTILLKKGLKKSAKFK